MTHDLEIDLTKGQAGFEGMNYCYRCQKYIEKTEDSVCIGVDFRYEWVHLSCFIKMCKPILEKAGYSSNPSKRDAH